MTEDEINSLLEAINVASNKWKDAFNSGNASECANQYEENAVMNAKPFGTFTGRNEIQAFWQNLIDDGFTDVEYIDPNIEVIDATNAVLSSDWKMNKASGVITKELWVLQPDGTAKLREDNFEVKG